MASEPKSYFTIPMRGFILVILGGFIVCNFTIAGLLSSAEEDYQKVKAQVPTLKKEVDRLLILRQMAQTSVPPTVISSVHEPESTSKLITSHKKKASRPQFKYVLIDESCVVSDPSCKECVLNEESEEAFSSLLRVSHDTLYVYTISDDLITLAHCTKGNSKFSDCVLGYIRSKFKGKFMCIGKLNERHSQAISTGQGGQIILANGSIGRQEIKKITKDIPTVGAIGFSPSKR
ncbi:MAG: hypothetical protein KIS77_22155 [Saprospiraceae bacterium]|nr:hypothetical protein [Saprospiraceae bacterium]